MILPPHTAVVIPCRDTHRQLPGVLDRLPPGLPTYIVDDGSEPPLPPRPGCRLLRHALGRGYGAAQKTGYNAALTDGARRILLLHGDGQYPVDGVLALARALDHAEVALGSRFLEHGGRVIPWWRRSGNRLLTGVANLRFGTQLSELHTGARAFRAETLRSLPFADFSDDYVFDQQVLVGALAAGMRFAERPVEASYDAGVQSIQFGASVRYGLGCLWTIAHARPPQRPG